MGITTNSLKKGQKAISLRTMPMGFENLFDDVFSCYDFHNMATISFKCKKCQNYFISDVGKITFLLLNKTGERPVFKKDILCLNCGKLTFEKEEVELTELGQSQLTELEISFFEQNTPPS
ncbi:MAG: hypothetical protein QME57_02895 [Patescibacteria group bacterium]|nr:hypothetical protein [Patescibacteria group bacterium]